MATKTNRKNEKINGTVQPCNRKNEKINGTVQPCYLVYYCSGIKIPPIGGNCGGL